ncbi:MAG: threonine-phosphate decarboxylase CobD [Bacillota bacterium]
MQRFEHGGNVWEVALKFGKPVGEIIDFSASLNPLGPPESVLALLRQNVELVRFYPQPFGGALKGVFALEHGVPKERVVVGNGAAELIHLLCRVIKPKRVLMPVPTFMEYERAVSAVGGEVDPVLMYPDDSFALPVPDLIRRIGFSSYDLLVLCNPNNPTGMRTSHDALGGLIEAAHRAGTFVLLDESFAGFLPEESAGPGGSAKKDAEHLFVLRSLTKLYCLPGLRLGYGIGPKAVVAAMDAMRDPWSVNVLAQLAGVRCLEDAEYVRRSVALVSEERASLLRSLAGMKVMKPFPSFANFILCDVRGSGYPAPLIRDRLGRRGILIRDCSNFRGLDQYYIRVAVRLPGENERLVEELRHVLEEE